MKINFKKLKNSLKRLPTILVEKFVLSFLFLLIFSLLILLLAFEILIKEKKQETPKVESFNQALYQKVLERWKEREKKFEEINQKIYLNPFEEK